MQAGPGKPSGEGGTVPAHVGRVHVVVIDVDPAGNGSRAELAVRSLAMRPHRPPASPTAPVLADAQAVGQQAAQQLAVGAVLRATDLADAVQAAERARFTRAAEGHELVRDHVHRDVLGGRGGRSEDPSDLAGSGEAPVPSLPGVASLHPSPGPPRWTGIPSSRSLPANLGGLASGLRQLLGELGEEPVGHGGAGHVGIHHKHRHDGGGMAGIGHRNGYTCRAAAEEPELRDLRPLQLQRSCGSASRDATTAGGPAPTSRGFLPAGDVAAG